MHHPKLIDLLAMQQKSLDRAIFLYILMQGLTECRLSLGLLSPLSILENSSNFLKIGWIVPFGNLEKGTEKSAAHSDSLGKQ